MGDINLTNQISVNHTSGTSITVTNNIAVTGAPGSGTGVGPGRSHQAGPSCSQQGGERGGTGVGPGQSHQASPSCSQLGGVRGGMEDDDICPSPQVSDVEPEARKELVGPQEEVRESPPQSSVSESEDRDINAVMPEEKVHEEKAGVIMPGGTEGEAAIGEVPSVDDGAEAEERPPQPPLTAAEAAIVPEAAIEEETRPETGPGAEVRRLGEWSEACQIKKCQRCLRKERQE